LVKNSDTAQLFGLGFLMCPPLQAFHEKPDVAGRINGGFFILKRAGLEKYLRPADDTLIWERGPLEKLARDKQLIAFPHDGFWHAMDTYGEFEALNKLWMEGRAPWKIW
jgi:glucose-1-phosphate cytidylyltransferase